MTLRVQGTISIDGGQAKAEAKAVASELRKVSADATGMGRASQAAGTGARALGAASRDTATELRALAAAERQAAAEAMAMGRSHTIGANGVANLTSQFNDIGVMLAAGQNPLQLAIQQGTQITQVFGNMGAQAAVASLGQAFLAMLSPLNLITIGTIAAGAALFQWLFQAGEEVQTLDDALQSLADSTEAYADANARAGATTADLRQEFGSAAEAARELLRQQAALAQQRAEGQTRAVSVSLQEQLGLYLSDSRFSVGNQQQLADLFDFSIWESEARGAINGVISAFRALDGAGTLDEQAVAAERLQLAFRAAAEASGEISFDENNALSSINELVLGLQRLKAESEIGSGQFVDLGELIALQAEGVRSVIAAEQERLAVVSAQEVVQNQILLFGRDSELVAQNRLAAERELYAAALEAAGATAEKAAQELAAWDAAVGFNAEAAGMPGLLSAAAGAAAGIAGNIWNAVTGMIALKQEQAAAAQAALDERSLDNQPGNIAMRSYGSRAPGGTATQNALEIRNRVRAPLAGVGAGTRSAGGGGASAAREERDAVEELIKKLEREIELERELDPVKRQMIQYREQLSAATAAEREQVESLIAQREREKTVTESLQWVGEQSGDALVDALMGAADAGDRLIETLKRAVLQALLLGSGPLAGLFGGGLFGGGGMGGLGSLIGGGDLFANIGGLAEGGMVYGAGGPTDDKVPRWLSPGEFVVNARATRRHRHMLEGLNAAPGMATGGYVGQGPAAGVPAGGVTIAPVIDARGAHDPAAVEAAARRGMALALEEYRRTGLPNDILRTLDSPNVRRF